MVNRLQDRVAELKDEVANDEAAAAADAQLQARISNDVMTQSLGVVAPLAAEHDAHQNLEDDDDDDDDHDVEIIYTNE